MVIIKKTEFLGGSNSIDSLPLSGLPEVAFAGRSNVGKSSLLNNIVNRKNLAHISSNPGKTRQINLFSVDDKWCLVDLPGYGYAAVSKKDRAQWSEMTRTYFLNRTDLKMICVLIDSRHDPMDTDLGMLEWLENNQLNYLVILTKCDKINKTQIEERKQQLEVFLQNCTHAIEVLPYSSVTGLGRNELIAIIKKNTNENNMKE